MKLGLFINTFRKNYNKVLASNWIRCLQMIPYYRKLGIDVHLNNPFIKYDISIYYRGMSKNSYYFINYLKTISAKVYWDTVVNYYVDHQFCNNEQRYYARKISETVDGVIVSSDYLKQYARKYNKTYYMPDPINFSHFRYFKNGINYTDPVFGWSGQSNKMNELNELISHQNNLKKIIIISNKHSLKKQNIIYYKWRYETFPYLISLCDIGLFPRNTNDIYNLGHSSFKILVYAAQGIPIIANKIPSYSEVYSLYDSICFIEDIQTLEDAIVFLKTQSRNIEVLKKTFSCEVCAEKLINFLIRQ